MPKTKKKNAVSKTEGGVTFDTVRQLALALPRVEEGTSYGTPAFRVSGKILARFHQDGESLVLKVEFVAREVLTATQPDMFYVTDHYRCWPFMLVRLKNVELNLLRGLIEEAWRGLASKRAIAEYEARD
ncbi:MAG TPA: MmcQ/YjbR family DNA-binding protein [Blastocatellia bacterium]|nr:MmcQ/YjbR family DNA-binding protein [Blastocatellia bacterium]